MEIILALTLFITEFLLGGTLTLMGLIALIYGIKKKSSVTLLGILFIIFGLPLLICSILL